MALQKVGIKFRTKDPKLNMVFEDFRTAINNLVDNANKPSKKDELVKVGSDGIPDYLNMGHFERTQAGHIKIKQNYLQHGMLSGLHDDDHAQYALLLGRSGGQILIGGTDSGDDLELQTTSDATKGDFIFRHGTIKLYDTDDSNYLGFIVPDISGDVTYTLPLVDGGAGEFLQTDGAGTLIWAATSGDDFGLGDLTDPNADRILFWDDSETALKWLGLADELSISTTTLSVNHDLCTNFVANEHIDWTNTLTNLETCGSVAAASTIMGNLSPGYGFATRAGVNVWRSGLTFLTEAGDAMLTNGWGFGCEGTSGDNVDYYFLAADAYNDATLRIYPKDNVQLRNGYELRFYDTGNSNYVGFEAPALTADKIWVLPTADGNANEALGTDGSGNLIWRTHDELANFASNEHFTEASIDHGSIAGLTDNDHTQYILHSLADAANDFLVASGDNAFARQTLAATGAILEGDIQHDNLQGVTANEHIDWTGASDNFSTSGTLGCGIATIAGSGLAGTLGVNCYLVSPSYLTVYRHKIESSVSSNANENKMDFSLCSGSSTGFTSILRLRSTGVGVTGFVDTTGGFKDNGSAGIDTTWVNNEGNTVTVSGGIITSVA